MATKQIYSLGQWRAPRRHAAISRATLKLADATKPGWLPAFTEAASTELAEVYHLHEDNSKNRNSHRTWCTAWGAVSDALTLTWDESFPGWREVAGVYGQGNAFSQALEWEHQVRLDIRDLVKLKYNALN